MRLAGIEGGIESTKLAPLLSALADGEADAEALAPTAPAPEDVPVLWRAVESLQSDSPSMYAKYWQALEERNGIATVRERVAGSVSAG